MKTDEQIIDEWISQFNIDQWNQNYSNKEEQANFNHYATKSTLLSFEIENKLDDMIEKYNKSVKVTLFAVDFDGYKMLELLNELHRYLKLAAFK